MPEPWQAEHAWSLRRSTASSSILAACLEASEPQPAGTWMHPRPHWPCKPRLGCSCPSTLSMKDILAKVQLTCTCQTGPHWATISLPCPKAGGADAKWLPAAPRMLPSTQRTVLSRMVCTGAAQNPTTSNLQWTRPFSPTASNIDNLA